MWSPRPAPALARNIGASKFPAIWYWASTATDFAVRMLKASVPSGIKEPLRFYVTENADGTATLTYRKPSAIFGVYGSSELDAMAKELDELWAKIVSGTTGK